MGPEWGAVIAIRVLLPLTILRWPLAGGAVAFLADTFDVVLLELLAVSDFGRYNEVDKVLDTYYLALEAWTCRAWACRLARNTALGLFAYRLVGVVLYELTATRALLFIFPNQFEAFFLAYLVYRRVAPAEASMSVTRLIQLNVGLLAIKEVQEYVLHVAQVPVYAYIRDYILIPLHIVGGTTASGPTTDELLTDPARAAGAVTSRLKAATRTVLPRLAGPNIWVLVNDESTGSAPDSTVDRGSVRFGVMRMGAPDDDRESSVGYRNLCISKLARRR